jgi:hypothetical protein
MHHAPSDATKSDVILRPTTQCGGMHNGPQAEGSIIEARPTSRLTHRRDYAGSRKDQREHDRPSGPFAFSAAVAAGCQPAATDAGASSSDGVDTPSRLSTSK